MKHFNYTKQQIEKAISFWTKKLNESSQSIVDGFSIDIYTDISEIDKLLSNIINMVIKTYEPIGGYYGQTNIDRLRRTTSMIKTVSDNGSIIACSFYRNVDGSFKIQAYANDSTVKGKAATKAIIRDDINNYDKWIWGEVSLGVEKYFKKCNGYPLPNEFAANVLNKPGDSLQLSQDGFHYKRKIGNEENFDEKVIFGFKDKFTFDKIMQIADYEMLKSKFNTTTLTESDNMSFNISTFNGACSFVNQLSDLYDEENLNQLTPRLSAMLDQSISILKYNIDKETWVRRTLEDAEYLRKHITTVIPIIKKI